MAPVIIFHGPPNSGKSTQGKLCAKDKGYRYISSGDELRNTKDPVIMERMQKGMLSRSEDVMRLMRAAIEKVPDDQGIVMDGFPRMIGEFKDIEAWFAETKRPLEVVFEISISEDESKHRASLRARHDDYSSDVRWKYYREETQKVLDYCKEQGLLKVVDGVGTPEEVAARVKATL